METRYDAVIYGTLALDLMWRMEKLPALGTYETILEERRMIGGEAANTAIALSKWGANIALLGTVCGHDEDAQFLKSRFAIDAPTLDISHLRFLPGVRTPFCVCVATPDGNRTMMGIGFEAMQTPILTKALAKSGHFFTADPNAWADGKAAMLSAKKYGMRVVAMDYTEDEAVNRASEISLTSHAHIGANLSAKEYGDYAKRIRDDFGTTAIVTWGEKGCFYAERNKSGDAIHFPAYIAPKVVDTTGAGDVFRAGILFGQIREWDLAKSVRFAAAAAALNCTELGAWAGVVSLEETLSYSRR